MRKRRKFNFLILASILLAVVALTIGGRYLYKNHQIKKFENNVSSVVPNSLKKGINPSPQFYGDSNDSVNNEMSLSQLLDNQEVAKEKGITKQKAGYLVINKINQTLPIYRGANQYTLSLGVATYYYDDAVMGEGNYVLGGHDMLQHGVMFSDLHDLVNGDAMDLVSEQTVFRYRVDSIKIVPEYITFINGKPEKGSILDLPEKNEKAKLTLFTCVYTDKGKERYVVSGHLSETYPNV